MDITAISDLHGFFPKDLPGGDLLIVAGDLTASDKEIEYANFDYWINEQNYKKKVVIPGNHDNFLVTFGSNYLGSKRPYFQFCDYLCDSGTEFEGLRIWGSPWTKRFERMNPHCMAFTVETDQELAKKWAEIPTDTDILITHSPPFGVLDFVDDQEHCGNYPVGSKSLALFVSTIDPKLHVFGHVHECHGLEETEHTIFVNASRVNEYYNPVNKPIRIEL